MKLPCYCETPFDERVHDYHLVDEETLQEIGVGFEGEEEVLLEE